MLIKTVIHGTLFCSTNWYLSTAHRNDEIRQHITRERRGNYHLVSLPAYFGDSIQLLFFAEPSSVHKVLQLLQMIVKAQPIGNVEMWVFLLSLIQICVPWVFIAGFIFFFYWDLACLLLHEFRTEGR